MTYQLEHSRIVGVDATSDRCPSITLNLGGPLATPALITLTICEWRRVAEQIVEAAHALHA
jgi:hypothetical protein